MPAPRSNHILGRGSWSETTRIAEILRKETVGGALLLLGTVVALVWINSQATSAGAEPSPVRETGSINRMLASRSEII